MPVGCWHAHDLINACKGVVCRQQDGKAGSSAAGCGPATHMGYETGRGRGRAPTGHSGQLLTKLRPTTRFVTCNGVGHFLHVTLRLSWGRWLGAVLFTHGAGERDRGRGRFMARAKCVIALVIKTRVREHVSGQPSVCCPVCSSTEGCIACLVYRPSPAT